MKDLCIWLVGATMMIFAARYAYQVWRRDVHPTLSTWIIFLAGTGLSLATYAIAENHDFRSGILNTIDVAAVLIILISILRWGNREVRFKPFEKWYLGGVGAIVTYGVVSGDAWHSNVFTQVLISAGYFPTVQTLIVEKKNVESFTAWGLAIVAGLIALVPAKIDGNTLASIYAWRTIACVSAILILMGYYELRTRRSPKSVSA